MVVKIAFEQIIEEISEKVSSIDLEGYDISISEALEMVEFFQSKLCILRVKLTDYICNP